MKKQFSINAIKNSSKNIIAAAKNESVKIFNFESAAKDEPCCGFLLRMQGANSKPVFSL